MWLSLLSLFTVLLLGLALGTIVSVWVGAFAAVLQLWLLAFVGRTYQLPLRFGRLTLFGLPLLIALGTGAWYARPLLQSQRAPTTVAAPLKPMQEDVEASAQVNKTQLVVDQDRLVYTLRIRYRKGLDIKLPKVTEHPTFNGPFVMPADQLPRVKKRESKDGSVLREWKITLSPVATGPLDTPRLVIRYSKKGKRKKVIVPRIAIEVTEKKKKAQAWLAELKPGKRPVLPEVPGQGSMLAWLGSSLLGVYALLALGLLFVLLRVFRKRQVSISAEEWVAQQLEALKRQKLLNQQEYKRHYFSLSEIVRGYFGRRYDFPAPEQTTEEILQWFRREETLSQDVYRDLRRFMQWLDSVKFAGYQPTEQESEQTDQRLDKLLAEMRPTEDDNAAANA